MGRTSDAKERLMQAALDLMWEESYGAVTIDDICKRADVKKGSFYYFFESKSDLAVAALESLWLNEMKPSLDAQFSPSREPLERLRAHLENVYTFQAQTAKEEGKVLGCPVCCMGSEICTQDEKLAIKVRELLARKRRYYESAIRDAIADGAIEPGDAAQKAAGLYALIDGSITQARILNDIEVLRSLPQIGLAMLQVRKPSASPTVSGATLSS